MAGDSIVFLVGAGRSGTTLVYKLMSLHPGVGYLSNYDERRFPAGRAARLVAGDLERKIEAWFSGAGNAYFVSRPLRKRFFPTPVEGEAIYRRCGLPRFPGRGYLPGPATVRALRRRFERIRRGAGAEVLVTKRTANNRRLRALETIFPRARFIHVIRDGREVADSLRRVEWWPDHRVWWDGRTAREIQSEGEGALALAARNWVWEIEALARGLAAIAPERILELRYEALVDDPVSGLAQALEFAGLAMSPALRSAVVALGLCRRPPAWVDSWSRQERDAVLAIQQPLLSDLGYG